MERNEFVEGEPGSWWFTDPAPDTRWSEARRELAESRGWQDPYWLTERPKVEELYGALESRAPHLLRELDYLAHDDDTRLTWIRSVQEALADPASAAPSEPVGPAPAGADGPPSARPAEAPRRTTSGIFARKSEGSQPDQVPEPGQEPPPVPTHVAEGVAQVLQSITGDGAAELAAELGITEEDVAALANDPEFERMVHEEAARLHQGQANG